MFGVEVAELKPKRFIDAVADVVTANIDAAKERECRHQRITREYYDAHPEERQQWQTVAITADVDALKKPSDEPGWTTLVTGVEWTLAIDISDQDQNQHYAVRLSVHVYNPGARGANKDGFRWQVADQYQIHRSQPFSGEPWQLMINDAPSGPLGIHIVEPPKFPGASRLTFAQIGGISSNVRFLRY